MALATWPARCYTCNYLIALRRDEYEGYLRQGLSRKDAMDRLGLQTMCCRKMVMSIPKYPMGYDVPIVETAETRRIPQQKGPLGGVQLLTQTRAAPGEVIKEPVKTRIRVYNAI